MLNSETEKGGLNMIDIYTMQQSFLLDWAEKYLSQECHNWKHLVNFFYNKIWNLKLFISEKVKLAAKRLFDNLEEFSIEE